MDVAMIYAVKAGLSWLIVALSMVGYLVMLRRTRERWTFWFVLAAGWTLLSVPNTFLAAGIGMDQFSLTALWLSSYVLVMASMVLLFLKVVALMRQRKANNKNG